MSLLDKWLNKRGINKVDDLTPEEKVVYDKYRLVLSGETLSVETIKEFCQQQIKIINSKCDGITPLTILQQASLHVYSQVLKAIEAPEAERASVEGYLTQIINE